MSMSIIVKIEYITNEKNPQKSTKCIICRKKITYGVYVYMYSGVIIRVFHII